MIRSTDRKGKANNTKKKTARYSNQGYIRNDACNSMQGKDMRDTILG